MIAKCISEIMQTSAAEHEAGVCDDAKGREDQVVASRLITWSQDVRLGLICADASGRSVPQILQRGLCHDSSVNVTIKIPASEKI